MGGGPSGHRPGKQPRPYSHAAQFAFLDRRSGFRACDMDFDLTAISIKATFKTPGGNSKLRLSAPSNHSRLAKHSVGKVACQTRSGGSLTSSGFGDGSPSGNRSGSGSSMGLGSRPGTGGTSLSGFRFFRSCILRISITSKNSIGSGNPIRQEGRDRGRTSTVGRDDRRWRPACSTCP